MIYKPTDENMNKMAEFIKNGGIVAIPTETVYGLGANALDISAVKKIFKVKGRPSDNPLIVHISKFDDIQKYAVNIPEIAYTLAEKFWPGPFTMILEKNPLIPDIVTAGLNSVALRFPEHKLTQKLIEKSGVPIAAPSANKSGKPSATCALHVQNDFGEEIDGIIDGGMCNYGIESTVISLLNDNKQLLRPGSITVEQLREIIPEIIISDAVLNKINTGEKTISPGLKHKHYAPDIKTIGITGKTDNFVKYIKNSEYKNKYVICFNDEEEYFSDINCISYGKKENYEQLAQNLFNSLRLADESDADIIYIHLPNTDGAGFAVYNRLLRACDFNIINFD